MRLTDNFSLEELTKSQVALRNGLLNVPSTEQVANLQRLCSEILQPLRDYVGPIVVNSGFRSPEVNVATGGSKTSDHCKGEAADIEAIEMDNRELAKYIKENFKFDQLILEFHDEKDPRSGWVHVSLAATGNRNQVLRAFRGPDGKTKYEEYGSAI